VYEVPRMETATSLTCRPGMDVCRQRANPLCAQHWRGRWWPTSSEAATRLDHGSAYDRRIFFLPLHQSPPPSPRAAPNDGHARQQDDSARSSGRSFLASTPALARSLPRAGLAQPRGGVSTVHPSSRHGSVSLDCCELGPGGRVGVSTSAREKRLALSPPSQCTQYSHEPRGREGARERETEETERDRELMASTPLRGDNKPAHALSHVVLHAPHSSAASPRLVMEPGSCFQVRFRRWQFGCVGSCCPRARFPHQHNIPRITCLHVDYLPVTLLSARSLLLCRSPSPLPSPAARSGKCLVVPFPIFVSSRAFCGRIATGDISSTDEAEASLSPTYLALPSQSGGLLRMFAL
jgi:hypothetical protein